jgi:hypothetical protein
LYIAVANRALAPTEIFSNMDYLIMKASGLNVDFLFGDSDISYMSGSWLSLLDFIADSRLSNLRFK